LHLVLLDGGGHEENNLRRVVLVRSVLQRELPERSRGGETKGSGLRTLQRRLARAHLRDLQGR